MLISDRTRIFLTLNIDRDVLHRAGTVERDDGDHVFDIVRPDAAERVAHARALELEHAKRLAARHQVVGGGVIEAAPAGADFLAAGRDELHRAVNDRQGLEAEEVELHEPGHLGIFHVELRGRQFRTRIIVERHEVDQRTVCDHHACRVGAGVAVEPFKGARDLDQFADARVRCDLVIKLGFARDRLVERRWLCRIEGDQLREPVHLVVGHLHHAADIAHDGLCLQRAERDDHGHAVGAVLVADIADHFAAPFLAEVYVKVRHRDAFGVQEALEQEVEPNRVKVCDEQRPGDQ